MNLSTQRRRNEVEVWHPKAHNLQLPHVPPEARQAIRKKLSPWLANLKDYDGQRVGVKFGDCWNIAQALTLTAMNESVQYVEGVWSEHCASHGWNLIDGYVVDLVDEFRIWQGSDAERLRESLNVYTVEDVKQFYEDGYPVGDMTTTLSFPCFEFQLPVGVIYRIAFWPAIEKLLSRLSEDDARFGAAMLEERLVSGNSPPASLYGGAA
jgi:hypothetical protein